VELQLQVVPGRPPAVPRVDPDRIGVPEMVGAVTAAAGQVDPAHERDAAPGPVGEVDDQQLLVVAAEAAHPLVGHQLPAGAVDHRAQDPVGVLVEPDQGRVGAPQQPPDGHPAAGEGGQQPVQPLEVRGPVHIHGDVVAGRPGLAVAVLGVDGRRRVATLVRGQEPGRGGGVHWRQLHG
jgi:hypothetical protein